MNWQSALTKIGDGMLLTIGFLIVTNLPKIVSGLVSMAGKAGG